MRARLATLIGVVVLCASVGAPAFAADVLLQRRTKTGSDVTIFADGTATLNNPAMRWSASGSWKKEGRKYCVDWRERDWPRQCYW